MKYQVIKKLLPHVDLNNIPTRGTIFRDARYHIMHGGRGGGKSVFVEKTLALEGYLSPKRILCAREIQKSISDSVMQGIWDAIVDLGLEGFYSKTKTEIVGANGTRFLFYGLRTNITSIKSISGIDLVWCEEAEAVSKDSWSTLIPSIRATGSRIIITFNPKNLLDDTYQRFIVNPPTDSIITKINWSDNPFFPEVLNKERLDLLRIDPDLYQHVWEGEPVAEGHLSIINPKWVRAAIDAHKKLGFDAVGKSRIGFDIADTGDNCAMVSAKGSVCTGLEAWRANHDELLKSCAKAYQAAYESHSEITYDVCGIGASAAPRFIELNQERSTQNGYVEVQYQKFNAGSRALYKAESEYMPGVTHKDHFANAKAQAWGLVADRFRNTFDAITNGTEYKDEELISIDSSIADLDQLVAELGQPQKDTDNNGRVIVESKKKLKERGVPSPDRADAFIMAFAPIEKVAEAIDLMF